MKIGVDLTFLKPKKTGGIEFYVINLLNGLFRNDNKNEYYLFMAKDNIDYFKEKFESKKVNYILCNTYANKIVSHLLWQITRENGLFKKYNIDLGFYPSYMMPFFKPRSYKTVTVIQDLQADHYPEYFPLSQRIWFKIAWKKLMFTADKIITTTEYTKKDIEKRYKHKNNIESIFIPIILNNDEILDFNEIKSKYDIERGSYYYTVLSMLKHKNLITLVKMIKKIKDKNIGDIPHKLLVSGVNGPAKEELVKKIKEMNLEEEIILTGFVSNSERNTLIKNCNVFLFPSIFEGFGMPPVEAMHFGARVITTKKASLPEVTMGKCNYVNNPTDESEWIKMIKKVQNKSPRKIDFKEFDQDFIAKKYLRAFNEVMKGR